MAVRYEREGAASVLTIDRPQRRNAVDAATATALREGLERFEADDEARVMILTGAGGVSFCAGADIAMLGRVSPEYKYYFCLHANETLLRLEQTPKLVIAAINGHCVGGGLEVAMAADLRVARAGAGKLGLPEVSLGVLPGTGGTQRLTRLLGRARAMELMVKGEKFDVERARELLARGAHVADVAARLGFADQPHFSRLFKRVLGLSPSRYARSVRATA